VINKNRQGGKMKKLVTSFFVSLLFLSCAQAGILQGKRIYASQLHEACGFTGEVMGKKYTAAEWKSFYQKKILAKILKKECPQSKVITDRRDLRSLTAFFVTFAKGSGNKAACSN